MSACITPQGREEINTRRLSGGGEGVGGEALGQKGHGIKAREMKTLNKVPNFTVCGLGTAYEKYHK